MYEYQDHLKKHPDFRAPVGLVSVNNESNKNNNNSGKAPVKQKEDASLDVPDNSAKPTRTNIFVWKQPNDVAASENPPAMNQRQVSTPTLNSNAQRLQSDKRKVQSHTNLNEHTAIPAKINPSKDAPLTAADDEIIESMNTMRLAPHLRTYRSETPAPQTQTKADSRFSTPQMRRAKTPTPGQHKVHLRRKSSTTDEIPRTYTENENDVPMAPPRRPRPKSMHVDALDGPGKGSVQTPVFPTMPYPGPSMGWTNPAQQNNYFNPGMYAYFVEMVKYYSTLSPEQKNMLNNGAMPYQGMPPNMPPTSAMVNITVLFSPA